MALKGATRNDDVAALPKDCDIADSFGFSFGRRGCSIFPIPICLGECGG